MFEALSITDAVSTGAVFTFIPIMSALFGYVLLRQITKPDAALALAPAGAVVDWVIFRADLEAKAMAYGYLALVFIIVWRGLLGHGWVAPVVWLRAAATVGPWSDRVKTQF